MNVPKKQHCSKAELTGKINRVDIAVLFIIFNRPQTTAQVFEAIRKAQPARLYVAADAPRTNNPADAVKCAEVKEIVKHVDWTCDVQYLFQPDNLGCSLGPRAAFNWFFQHEEEGIILEDDCLPNQSFFTFCKEMLERYRHNNQIISINGCNLGYQSNNGDSYSFSQFMNMWGWATWKRSADKIDYALTEWKAVKNPLWFLYRKLRTHTLDFDINWYKYWQHKFDLTVTKENITWWDWQWIYHQLRDKQLSVVPSINLVTNIGFNKDGTHTKEDNNPASSLQSYAMQFPLQHPKVLRRNVEYEEYNVKWVWCYHKRMKFINYLGTQLKEVLKR